jgi:TPR repeat protein
MKAKLALVCAVAFANSYAAVLGQIPRSGLPSEQQRENARFQQAEAQRALDEMVAKTAKAAATQRQSQAAALRAQQQALLRERLEVTNRVYSRFPRPLDQRNRIVNGEIHDSVMSAAWGDIADLVSEVKPWTGERLVNLRVQSFGPTSIVCEAYENERGIDPSPGQYEDGRFIKDVLVYHHPSQVKLTTGQRLPHCRAMRVANWQTNGTSLEAYDCGLPDTAENRKKAGVPIPTMEQIAAAEQEIADIIKQNDAKRREPAVLKRQAADAAALKWNLERAEKGDAYGLLRMGQRYRDGEGVEKDLNKAKDYFRKAVDAGSTAAEGELSKMLETSTKAPDSN